MPALTTFCSVTLAVNTPVQLTLPSNGHFVLTITNGISGGKLFISNLNNPGANATSFLVPAGLMSPPMTVTDPIWIASDTIGTVSIYCSSVRQL